MEITLRVNGRKMTFSEKELTAFAEEHFARIANVHENDEIVEGPTEGNWFEVNPRSINQMIFVGERDDRNQERARQLILEAFEEVNKDPERYGRHFKTIMPKKTWDSITVGKLEKIANGLGDHIADWVEQALEWAQRIYNGESWEDVCNNPDTANWYRLVKWKNDIIHTMGGADKICDKSPSSRVGDVEFYFCEPCFYSVPLIVAYC